MALITEDDAAPSFPEGTRILCTHVFSPTSRAEASSEGELIIYAPRRAPMKLTYLDGVNERSRSLMA